jgi:hypothetical protein
MFPIHPSEARILAEEHIRSLRDDATTACRRPSTTRRALANWLRGAAMRLDPPALASRPVY